MKLEKRWMAIFAYSWIMTHNDFIYIMFVSPSSPALNSSVGGNHTDSTVTPHGQISTQKTSEISNLMAGSR